MATNKVCTTEYAIDLDSTSVIEASQDIAEPLNDLDLDGDRLVTDEEAGGTILAAPLSGDTIEISTPQDLEFYDKLLHSAVNARPFARFASSVHGAKQLASPTAENWAITDNEASPDEHGLYCGNLNMLDVRCSDKATELLFRRDDEEMGALYFSVMIPDDLGKGAVTPITIEFNGARMLLKDLEKSGDTDFLQLKRDVLGTLLAILPDKRWADYFPDGFSAKTAEYLEALSFQSSTLPPPTSHQAESATKKPDSDTIKRVYSNQNPVIATTKIAGLAANYPVGIRHDNARAPLTDLELARTRDILNLLSKNQVGVLAKHGTMNNFTVEIVDDDVMDAAEGPQFAGKYCNWLHKVLIRRSTLSDNAYTDPTLRSLFTHELGHGLFPNDFDSSIKELPLTEFSSQMVMDKLTGAKYNITESRPEYFLTDYLADLTLKAKVAKRLPSIDIYSLKNVAEFLAQCSVAYLTGEANDASYLSSDHGVLSRAELREKLPEMYLAFKLFYEPDSPYFGDLDLFSKKSKTIYDTILTSDHATPYLDKNTPVADLVDAYNVIDYYGELPG